MDVPDQSDHGSDEHVDTADDEQPGTGGHQRIGEEHETAGKEPQSDEHVVGNADELVALADDELFMADVESHIAVAGTHVFLLSARKPSDPDLVAPANFVRCYTLRVEAGP